MTHNLPGEVCTPKTGTVPASKRLLLVTDRFPASPDDFHSAWILEVTTTLNSHGIAPEVFTTSCATARSSGKWPMPVFHSSSAQLEFRYGSRKGLRTYLKFRDYLRNGALALTQHLQRHSYDHVIALGAFPSGWVAWQACEPNNIPFSIWSLGNDINDWARRMSFGRLVRQSLRHAANLYASGDKLSDTVTSISGRECCFLPTFRRLHYRMFPMPREHYFLYVGAIEKRRGVFDLLKAFARIRKDIWDYRLLIVGSGSQENRLQKAITSLHLRGKVHALGNVSDEELVNYLQRAKALIIPSHSDSIPIALGEALQTATPLVVTDVGDLGTLVRDNKLGFVARRKSPSSLADAMVRMMVSDLDIRASAKQVIDRLLPENAVRTLIESLADKT